MEIDEILIKSSTWTWNKLREARKLGFQLGEESITDFLILNIKKHGGSKLRVDSFTRHKESLNGADWEWWFTGPSGKWVGMRIQAKVLKLDTEKYEHLHHHNKNGQQVDLLVQDALRNRMIPAYCMFTNWEPSKYNTPWKCKSHKTSVRHYGTALLSSKKVKQFSKKKTTHLSAIIEHLRPMHCMFCCSGSSIKDLPHRALHYAKSNGLLDFQFNTDKSLSFEKVRREFDNYVGDEEYRDDKYFELLIHDNPPYYVEQVISGELDGDFLDVHDERLKTVTIFREVE